MDISKITDVTELKALGFDEVARIGQAQQAIQEAQQNLQAIETRIAELEAESKAED